MNIIVVMLNATLKLNIENLLYQHNKIDYERKLKL